MTSERRRFRFSLRTLVLFVAVCGSGFGLWAHWGPWHIDKYLTIPEGTRPSGVAIIPGESTALVGLVGLDAGRKQLTYRLSVGEFDILTGQRTATIPTQMVKMEDKDFEYAPDASLKLSNGGQYLTMFMFGTLRQERWPPKAVMAWPQKQLAWSSDPRSSTFANDLVVAPDESFVIVSYWLGPDAVSLDAVKSIVLPEGVTNWAVTTDAPLAIAISGDSTRVAVGTSGQVLVLDSTNGNLVLALPCASNEFREVAFLLDSRHIVIAEEATLTMWNLDSQQPLWRHMYPASVSVAIQPSPNGYLLISATGVIWMLDAKSGSVNWQRSGFHHATWIGGGKAIRMTSGPFGAMRSHLIDRASGIELAMIPARGKFSHRRDYFVASEPNAAIWRKYRPEYWWGVAWLPEFWLTLALTLVLLWSVRRDWRGLRTTG